MNSSQLESGRTTGHTQANLKINSAIPINKYYENKRPSLQSKNYYTSDQILNPISQQTYYQQYLPESFDSQQISRTNQAQQLRSQTQKAFMKKRMQDDWRQINSMYTKQEMAQNPVSNYNQINPEDQSLSARQRIKKIVKKQMQLPKIYQDQFPIDDQRSKNSISPMQDVQGTKTAQRFRDQNGNYVYSTRNKKFNEKINYKKAYSSQNNMDSDHKPSDYESRKIRIIKVDQESFDKLARSLRKGDPIDKVLQLLEPGRHQNKKINVNTEHPYLQKVLDKSRSSKRSKTTHHFIRPNQQQEVTRDNMTYILNANLHKDRSPLRPDSHAHPYQTQDTSQFGREELKPSYKNSTRLEKKLRPTVRSRDTENPASFVKTEGNSHQKEGHYFQEDEIQQIKEERHRQRIANRVNKLSNHEERLNSQKHMHKNLILATSSNERLEPKHEAEKFIKMGNVEQHVKPYQRRHKGHSHLENEIKQRACSILQTPIRLPKKKIHKKNTGVVYEASPNKVCPRCQMVPPEKRMMLAHTKLANENPSLKQSLLESLEHSSRLMQYKVTLHGKNSKFYRMPASYYQQIKDKKQRRREPSQITVSVGSCSCPQEIATRESQRVSSNSPQSRKEKEKLVRVSAKNLSQPYVPCRRTCSTLHHPHIHETRVTMIQAARLRSTGRLAKLKASIISKAEQMKQQSERAKSAKSVDSGIRKKNELLSQIDWVNSKIYMNIQFYNQQNNKEGSPNKDLQDTLGKNDTPFGDDPILFFIKNAEQGFDGLDIYSETEVRYLLDQMKQKFEDNDVGIQAEVNYVFEKALRTLECYMNMLLLGKAFESIKEQYQQTTNKQQTVVNCIKVLMRCTKMTEAIIAVKKILKTIIQREQMVTGAIEKGDKNKTLANYDRIITMTMRIFKMIERLQDENHNLRRPFIIHREEYKETTITQMKFMKDAIEKQFEIKVERIINSQGELELVQNDE